MKTKHHEIDYKEFQIWKDSREVIYASSERESKSLICTLNGGIKVMVAGKITWQGIQPYSAIEAYNSITEEFVSPLKEH